MGELGEIVDAAAFDPQHWSLFIERLQAAIPGTKICIQVSAMDSSLPLFFSSVGWSEQSIAAYKDYYWSVNPWQEAWLEATMSKVERSELYFSHRALEKTEFFADFLQPEGSVDGATGVKFAAHRGRQATLAIHSDIGEADRVEVQARSLIQRIVPRMRSALEANRITGDRPLPSGGHSLLDGLLDAAFLVDENCRLRAANSAALALASEMNVLNISPKDIVRFRQPAANDAFARLVSSACSQLLRLKDRARPDDLVLDLPEGSYAIAALPVARAQTGFALALYSGQIDALVVMRHRPPPASRDGATLLRRAYGLTAAEARLALALDRGGTLVEIAARLGVSYETVRAQLKAAFTKTGTRKQRDLLALVIKATSGNLSE